jgi:sugar lactone lactonase YvrE
MLWAAWPRLLIAQSPYTFSTIAGTPRVSGTNDGAGSIAQFNTPAGIAHDRDGNLYVADTFNQVIRQIQPGTTNWAVSTIVGLPKVSGSVDGYGTNALLNRPDSVAVDQAGNIFFSDRNNVTIRMITRVGTNWSVTTIAGSGHNGGADGTNFDASFWLPSGVAVDPAGNVYVADASNFAIRKITPQGTNWVTTTIAGEFQVYGSNDAVGTNAHFNFPRGLTMDRSGNLFVADFGNSTIRKLTPSGNNWVVTTPVGVPGINGTNDGVNNNALFNSPVGITSDRAGNLYVTDWSSCSIRKVAPVGADWVVTTIGGLTNSPGTNDGPGSIARFNKPWGIDVDDGGLLYIVDYLNSTIRMGLAPLLAPPPLQIRRSANQVLLSWPLSAQGFTLQSASTPRTGATWTPVTNAIGTNVTAFVVSNTASAGNTFYRLHHP